MEQFGQVFEVAWSLFSIDMNLYGFTFSFKDAFIWSMVAIGMILFVRYLIFD